MSQVYRMKPHPKRVIWAGATLGPVLGITADGDQPAVGEALDASGLSEMPSHVSGGADDGLSLCELFEREADALMGCPRKPGQRFPMLVKRLDAKETLSVQVHPNDAMAECLENEPNGKAEAWYILEAKPGAAVHLGFKEGTTRNDVEKALEKGGLIELLRRVPVSPGDVIPVPAGCAHTIGAGIYLFEVQQTSDLTYRLDDFGRLDHDGNPRELHIKEGLASIDIDLRPDKAVEVVLQDDPGGKRTLLVDMEAFSIEKWDVETSLTVTGGSLLVVQGLGGTCSLAGDDNERLEIQEGETLIVSSTLPSLDVSSADGGTLIVARQLKS